MYLPQTQIDAMLRRCGYPCFDGGFVSCTYGVQKRSGRLFKRFLQETGLTARQLLFIGDSWRADVAGAALAGITAWHLPTPPAPADNAAAFVENRLPQQRSTVSPSAFPCWDRWQRHSANGCTRAVPPARRPGCISSPAICT